MSVVVSHLLVDSLAKVEAARHRSGLKLSALGRRMGGDVARDCDQDVAPRRALTPLPILLHASLEHLICMEFGVLAQDRARKCGDKRFHRIDIGRQGGQPS